MNQQMVDEAFRLASSRQMCCQDDLRLLIKLVTEGPILAQVVQLGAGSGTMALAILGAREDAILTTVDNDLENLNWEALALSNAGFVLESQAKRYHTILFDSAECGRSWSTDVDLIVIDADHSYEGMSRDLQAWAPKADLVFCHDYDGTTAPQRYPGVQRACDEYFGEPPIMKCGWSAVFEGKL